MSKQITGERAWGAWLAATAGSFAVLEALAYRRRAFPTLSATLSRWLGTHPPAPWGDAAPLAFGAAWLALTLHIVRYRPRVVLVSESDAVSAAEEIAREAVRRLGRDTNAH